MVGAVFSPQAAPQQHSIPEVERMRRGRVPAAQSSPQPGRPSPSPGKVTSGDPFAALDARSGPSGGDELSSRFPTLDQFALLHDKGQKFDFDSSQLSPQQPKDLSTRVAERLADEAFQVKPTPSATPAQPVPRRSIDMIRSNPSVMSPPVHPATAPPQAEVSRASAIISSTPELQALSPKVSQTPPQRPLMVSIGTMTSPSLDQLPPSQLNRFSSNDRHRAASVPRSPVTRQDMSLLDNSGVPGVRVPSLPGVAQSQHLRYPSSSRPSLEGGRPSVEQLDSTRPKSRLAARPRPVSTHLESNLDFLREQESRSRSPALPSPRASMDRVERSSLPPSPVDDLSLESGGDFRRSREELEPKKKEKSSKHHLKRGSLSSLGAGTKNILAGKFGDAFKRFESSNSSSSSSNHNHNHNNTNPPTARTPSPLKDLERRELTPIPGSETVDGRSDDGQSRDWEDMTPEMRREQEARMLAQEEARVAAAQAEHRQRVAQRGGAPGSGNNTGGAGGGPPMPPPKSIGGVSRVASIQNKVQSLIDESNRSAGGAGVVRTAQGYGPYSDAAHAATAPPKAPEGGKPAVPRKPVTPGPGRPGTASGAVEGRGVVAPSSAATTGGGRPMAPPKPMHLNKTLPSLTGGGSGSGRAPSPVRQQQQQQQMPPPNYRGVSSPSLRGGQPVPPPSSSVPPGGGAGGGTEALLAVELPGGGGSALLRMTAGEREDYISDFQKRFPSLGAIEMVERDLAKEEAGGRR